VLRKCLSSPLVDEVRVVVRRSTGIKNFKLREIVHTDFLNYTAIASTFEDVDACFYCLGISVMQVSGQPEYRRITHDFAMEAARTLKAHSPDALFHFISGRGASLTSRQMWARVKAETERDLMKLNGAVCWRPAAIDGVPSVREPVVFKMARPILRLVFGPFRGLYVKGDDIGAAMLEATTLRLRRSIFENAELRNFADQWNRRLPQADPNSNW
jgi:hypothetical protein